MLRKKLSMGKMEGEIPGLGGGHSRAVPAIRKVFALFFFLVVLGFEHGTPSLLAKPPTT
jgi:hypothetical protein